MSKKSGVFFSKNNLELSYKLKRLCGNNSITLSLCSDYSHFFSILKKYEPDYIFFDGNTIKVGNEHLEIFTPQGAFPVEATFIIQKEHSYYNYLPAVHLICQDTFESELNKFFCVNHNDYNKSSLSCITSGEISDYLKLLGFGRGHLGSMYLKEVLLEIIRNRSYIKSINSYVYPLVASKFSTSVANVERNIRTAIKRAYLHLKEDKNEQFMHLTKPPSNKVVISYVLDSMIRESRHIG